MTDIPKPNEIYRHFKGNLYRIITVATHSETREQMVVYQALYGDYQAYVRPLEMFVSDVDGQKYPDVTQRKRFERIPQVGEMMQPGQEAAPTAPIVPVSATAPVDQETPQPLTEGESELDPFLLGFLDADTYEEKLNFLAGLHARLTDHMVNTMAASLDVELNEGSLEERYEALKNCLLTLERYECARIR